jgi:hypothetical protein
MRTRKAWVALGVVALLMCTGRRLSAGDGQPESYEFTLNGTSKGVALRVKAPGRPAIVWEDVSGRGEPIRGVRIGGLSWDHVSSHVKGFFPSIWRNRRHEIRPVPARPCGHGRRCPL